MPPLVLSDDEVQHLQSIANSRSLPHSIVQRAQIVLACGAGERCMDGSDIRSAVCAAVGLCS
jgi:hypothetical protein